LSYPLESQKSAKRRKGKMENEQDGQLHIYYKDQNVEAVLVIWNGCEKIIGLRPDLQPAVTGNILSEACHITETTNGKTYAWLDGRWVAVGMCTLVATDPGR
jgi:hypothetical protein